MQDLAWDDVRVFLAVIRARTAGIAAKSLGVDVSTVSRRLSVLEERLGATLFERGRAGTIAMDAARALVPIAEQMEDAMQRFATAADTLDREIGGVVRIACPADVAEIVVAPLLPALLRAHPALRIDLDAGEAVVDLARREADLALRVVRPQHGDLVVTRLVGVRWVVAGAPHLVRSLGTLRAWDAAPWIGWGDRLAHTAPERWRRKHAGDAAPVARSDSLRVQLAMAATGLGLVLVPEGSLAHAGLARVKLAPALRTSARTWPVDDLYLVAHAALRDVPRVRVVWELLARALRLQRP